MSDVSKPVGSDYRGVAMPAPGFTYANIAPSPDSSYNQANPRPGVPVCNNITDMVVETSGNMQWIPTTIQPNPTINVTTQRGGMPGIGGQVARYIWDVNFSIKSGQSSTFGWDSPNAISRVECVDESNATPNGCITLQSNVVLVGILEAPNGRVYRKAFNVNGEYSTSGSAIWAWGTASSVASVVIPFKNQPIEGSICFMQLPQGRVHAYSMFTDDSVAGFEFMQLQMCWSDDDGVTWAVGNEYCLREQINASGTIGVGEEGFTIARVRVAYSDGQTLLLVHARAHNTSYALRDTLFQYASSDLGHTFDLIDLSGATRPDGALVADTSGVATGSDHAVAYHDICVLKGTGGFGVTYARVKGAAGEVGSSMWKELGNAYTTWTNVSPVLIETGSHGSIASQLLVGTNTTVASDENGLVLASWQVNVGDSRSRVTYDYGVTWTIIAGELSTAASTSTWWDSGDANFYPGDYCSTFQCGRCLIFAQFYTPNGQEGATADDKLWEIDLGGYTTGTRAHKNSEEREDNQLTWEVNWMCSSLMTGVAGWTAAGAGTETLVGLPNVGSRIQTGAGQTKTLTNTTLAAVAGGKLLAHGMFECNVDAGSSRLEVLIGDGANIIRAWLEFNTTNFLVKDIVAGTTAYNAAAPGVAWNQVMWAVSYDSGGTSYLSAWVRNTQDSATNYSHDFEVRAWKQVLDRQALGLAASATASRIAVDQPENSDSRWREIHWGSGIYGQDPTDKGSLGAAKNNNKLWGRAWSPYPIHIYAGDGLRVSAVDGPTWSSATASGTTKPADSWKVQQRWEYGIENLFAEVSPSPRRTWRSASLAQQDIAVNIGQIDNDPAPLLGRVLVVGLFNANFQKMEVHYRQTAGAALTLLGTVALNQGQTGLRWIRDGRMVRPDTSGATSAPDYFTYNILEDSHIRIKSALGGTPDVVRTIGTNHEGTWTNGLTVRPTLYCTDILSTDGTAGTTGEIWSKDGLLILHDMPDVFQLVFRIPAGITAEGYFELGTLFVGHLAYFGKQYARGRTMGYEPNYDLTTGRAGTRRGRSLGPTRRGVDFAWANENVIDTTQLAASTLNPDYILAATGSTFPVATPADTSYKMAGLVEALRGAASPCLYLSKVPMVSNENVDTVLVNRNLFMLGRITGAPRLETVLGSEWGRGKGEVVRIASIPFDEEV